MRSFSQAEEHSEIQDEEPDILSQKKDKLLEKDTQKLEKLDKSLSRIEEDKRVVYSHREKWGIVVLASCAGIFSSISSPIYLPAIPELEKTFHSTTEMLNLTVTIYSVFQGISPMFWGSISDVFGRRPILIICMLIYVGSTIGLALCNSYALLFGMRILQAFGVASTIAIGGGIVGDITTKRNRGTFLGLFGGLSLIGNCFGPLIGGAVAGRFGWRGIFWFLVISSGLIVVLLMTLLPETNHEIVDDGSTYPSSLLTKSPYIYFRARRLGVPAFSKNADDSHVGALSQITHASQKIVVKVFQCFHLLSYIDVVCILVPAGTFYTTWFMGLTALSSLLSSNYGFNITQIGASYLASGVGALFGSIASGRLVSYRYKKQNEKFVRQCEEKGIAPDPSNFNLYRARLDMTPYFGFGVAISSIIFGWTIEYNVHYVVPIIMTFFTSLCSVSFMSGVQTLLVDIFPGQSASSQACLNIVRCLLCAIGLAVVDRMIRDITVGWTFTLMAFLSLLTLICILTIMRLGPRVLAKRSDL